MKLDPKIVEAGRPFQETSERDGELNARRVILALAENMPEDAVDAAQQELSDRGWLIESPHLRAAIATFLKHVAGETHDADR